MNILTIKDKTWKSERPGCPKDLDVRGPGCQGTWMSGDLDVRDLSVRDLSVLDLDVCESTDLSTDFSTDFFALTLLRGRLKKKQKVLALHTYILHKN